jgi:hypothetical protein
MGGLASIAGNYMSAQATTNTASPYEQNTGDWK